MKVRVLKERCVGHSMCKMACPEVFALDDDEGLAIVRMSEVPAEFAGAVDQAVRGCPEGAIVIDEV